MTAPIPEWNDNVTPAESGRNVPPPATLGCLVVSALFVAILFAAVTLGVQTKVGCDLLASALKRQTGLDVTVESASVEWPLGICLTDVQTKPSTTPFGSFKAREIRIGLRTGGGVEISLRGARLELMKLADGWVPEVFSKVGALNDVRDTAVLFGDDPRVMAVDVRDSGIVWNGPDGERMSSAEGVGISIRPVMMNDQRMTVFEVAARIVRRANGMKGLGIRRLWLSSRDTPYLEVEYQGLWDGADNGTADWWTVPPGAMKRGMKNE